MIWCNCNTDASPKRMRMKLFNKKFFHPNWCTYKYWCFLAQVNNLIEGWKKDLVNKYQNAMVCTAFHKSSGEVWRCGWTEYAYSYMLVGKMSVVHWQKCLKKMLSFFSVPLLYFLSLDRLKCWWWVIADFNSNKIRLQAHTNLFLKVYKWIHYI